MIRQLAITRGAISYDVSDDLNTAVQSDVNQVKLRSRCQILFFERLGASNQRRQDIDDEIRCIQTQLKVKK